MGNPAERERERERERGANRSDDGRSSRAPSGVEHRHQPSLVWVGGSREGGSRGHQRRTACATPYRGRQQQGPQPWPSEWCRWRRGPSVWAPAAEDLGGPPWPARASAPPARAPSPYGRASLGLGREMEGYVKGAGDEESESLREIKNYMCRR